MNNQEQNPSDYCLQLEDIPEVEADKENWDDGWFDDVELLNHHNATEESDRIHHEYSAYFEKVEDQEYSLYHTTHLELHSHRLYGEKTRSLESRLARKRKKNQHLRERRLAHT